MTNNKSELYPLGLIQEDIFFHQIKHSDSALYNIGGYIILSDIDEQRLIEAHRVLTSTDDVFGTRLIVDEQGVQQYINDERNTDLPLVDFSGQDNVEQAAKDWMQELFETPIDIESDQLFKAFLLKIGGGKYFYLGMSHHLIMDGWSYSIWVQQLCNIYKDKYDDQYAKDYWHKVVASDIEYLHSKRYQSNKNFWLTQNLHQNRLFKASQLQPLNHQKTSKSQRVVYDLPIELTQRIAEFTKQLSISHSHFYLALISVYLFKACKQSNLVFASPFHNRKNKRQKKIFGAFSNICPMIVSIQHNGNFIDLLKSIANKQREILRHQRYPLGHLLRDLNYYDMGKSFFDISFNYLKINDNNIDFDFSDLVYLSHNHEKIPLNFNIWENSSIQDVVLNIDFNQAYFNVSDIDQIFDRLLHLFDQVLNDPNKSMAELSILNDIQYKALLQMATGPQQAYPQNQSIHQLFEAKAESQGDHIAVIDQDKHISYAELNQSANKLAHLLISQGVKSEVLVGLYMHRSVEMVVAILAVLKAGGAYVPLQPDYPKARIDYMIEDTGLEHLITQEQWQQAIKSTHVIVLDFESIKQQFSEWPNTNPDYTSQHPHDLAYVIYTSGSTGQPKGVMIEHQALMNRIDWMQKAYQLTDVDRVMQKTPFGFDVSVWEFVWTLGYGATLVVAKPDGHKDPEYLLNLIQKQSVSIMHFVPSMLRAYLDFNGAQLPQSLRCVICSGEALGMQEVQKLSQHSKHVRLINLYGPTEAAIDVSHFDCRDLKNHNIVPIGQAIQNTYLLVLNESFQLMPPGCLGELFIGGDNLARGYLNQPELTHQKFIADPHHPGQRLYRTGDLVRYLDEGQLSYEGRTDNQVKIRGFRIELGEIEQQLSSHHQVGSNAVVIIENNHSTHLIAYFTLAIEQEKLLNEAKKRLISNIAEHLRTQLPEHMIPVHFELLDALPVTSNGKVDRTCLSQREVIFDQKSTYLAPSNKAEQQLVDIWAQVLNIPADSLSINANFFALGGDSISSIQVVSKAIEGGLKLSVKQIFEHNTIERLAPHVVSSVFEADQHAITGLVPLLPIQHDLFYDLTDLHHFNQSLLLHVPDDFNYEILTDFIEKIYLRHDALRLRFTQKDHQWQSLHHDYEPKMLNDTLGKIQLDTDHFDGLAEQAQFFQTSLSIHDGPMFRAVYCENNQTQKRLLLIIHHLLVDGVSWRIIIGDLNSLYQQYKAAKPLQLAAKTSSYQAWSKYLQTYSHSEALIHEKKYWLGVLSTQTDLRKTSDREPQVNSSYLRCHLRIDQQTTAQLLTDAHKAYKTHINELLLSALLLSFNQQAGHTHIRLDLESHGRHEMSDAINISQTVGWFTSVFPFVMSADEMDVKSVICAIKEQHRRIPNQGVGFGVLKNIFRDEEILKADNSSILFNYLGVASDTNEPSAFSMSFEPTGECISPKRKQLYDLVFNGFIIEGCLTFDVDYNPAVFKRPEITALLDCMHEALHELNAHCLDTNNGCLTPADFPIAEINQQTLDRWQNSYQIDNIYPATAMQTGMFFHSSINTSSYNTQLAFTVGNNTDVEAFKQAWQQVVSRHDILRTAFLKNHRGVMHQLVLRTVELPWLVEDVSDLNSEQQLALITTAQKADNLRGHDLQQAPLLRVQLWNFGLKGYRVLFSHHHALLDGWSLPIMLTEVINRYQAIVTGTSWSSRPPVPYATYIKWLLAQNTVNAIDFWQQELCDVEQVTRLSRLSRNDVEISDGMSLIDHHIGFSGTETQMLRQWIKDEEITMNTLLQAAWSFVLSHYCHEQTVVFCTTVSGRSNEVPNIDEMIGLFINTLIVRVDVHPDSKVSDWLKSLHQKQIQRNEFSHLPLIEVQRQAFVLSKEQPIESLLVVENYPLDEESLTDNGQLSVSDINSHEQTNFDITISAHDHSDTLDIHVKANVELFEQHFIAQIGQHLKNVIVNLPKYASQPLSHLPILDEAQRQHLLKGLNPSLQNLSKQKPVYQIIEQQASECPNHLAIQTNLGRLTYRELNEKANQLSHYMVSKGLKSGKRIGVYMSRSLGLMPTLLAILKAGNSYVALEPSHPNERLAYIIGDAEIDLIVADSVLKQNFLSDSIKCLYIDVERVEWTALETFPDVNPDIKVSSNDEMYTLYTSGSTGQPKGVMINHGGVTNYLNHAAENYINEHITGSIVSSPLCFDATVTSLFTPLLLGKSVELLPECDDVIALIHDRLFQSNRAYLFKLTPAHLEALAHHRENSHADICHHLVVGGEQFSTPLLKRWKTQLLPLSAFSNEYGPTETVVGCCVYTVQEQQQLASIHTAAVPIGRPINNISLYGMNANFNLQAKGAVSELYIGGAGVANGYINQAELNANSFRDNPFQSGRLYKTGDLVRYLPNGDLLFIGRVDAQVNIRGYRIELGEIEQQLSQLDLIQNHTVAAVNHRAGASQLVAYVTHQTDMTEKQVMSYVQSGLGSVLPSYMIPAHVVIMKELPLTINGKIDKKALPIIAEPIETASHVAPMNEAQEKLCKIWSEVLNVPIGDISIEANFFFLGGDSILAIQMVSRALEAGLKVTVKQLVEHKTIAGITPYLESSTLVVEQGAVMGLMPLLPIQQAFFSDPTDLHHFNQSILLKVPNDFSIALLSSCVQHIYLRHDALRLRFYQYKGLWSAEHHPLTETMVQQTLGQITLNRDDFSGLSNQASDYQRSLSIHDGPVFRAVYCSNKTGEKRLLLIIHHLVVDGVSWRILTDDIKLLYKQNLQNQPLQLADKTASYQQWGHSLQLHSDSKVLQDEKQYWQTILAQPVNELSDFYHSKESQSLSMQTNLKFDESVTSALLTEAHDAYNTQINELLLSALLMAFYRHKHIDSLRIDLESHGRQELNSRFNVNETVGWFTSIFPLVLSAPAMDSRSVICHIKESHRSIPSHGIGFGLLKYMAESQAFDEHEPSPILFNYLGQFNHQTDSDFSLRFNDLGEQVSVRRKSPYDLTFNGLVDEGCLRFEVDYKSSVFGSDEISALLHHMKQAIYDIVDHCCDVNNAGHLTPSDFPMSVINQNQLNQWQQLYDIKDIYPATAMQQGLIYHSVMDSSSYVTQQMFTLDSEVNLSAFRQAWQCLLDRHDVLRTVFVSGQDGEIQQLVLLHAKLSWSERDVSSMALVEQDQQIEQWRLLDKDQGFDLKHGPLLRLMVWNLGEQGYRIALNMHHSIIDGWSMPLLFTEVMQHYEQLITADDLLLPAVVPFKHYVAWLQQQDTQVATDFWKQELSAINEPTLIGESLGKNKQSGSSVYRLSLDNDLSQSLLTQARDLEITINDVLQTAWAYVLSRYCDQQSVVFNTTVSGRPEHLIGVEKMVGLFINTVPVRVDVPKEGSCAEWLRDQRVKQTQRNQYSYLPLVDIQQLAPTNHSTLTDVLFVFENYPFDEQAMGSVKHGLIKTSDHKTHEETTYDLTVTAFSSDVITIEFATAKEGLSKNQLIQLANHYQQVLSSIAQSPQQPVASIELLTEPEKHHLLYELNDLSIRHQPSGLIHDLFEQQATKNPDDTAVVFAGQSISYTELNNKANQLAHYLIDQGVKSDDLVGICAERSVTLIMAILATLKAGAGFVPLDPTYPANRLAHMLHDTGTEHVLSQALLIDTLQPEDSASTIWLDVDDVKLNQYGTNNPGRLSNQSPSNLAYVIYTSGSTGLPKGVMIEHQQWHSYIVAALKAYSITQSQVILSVSSIGFDIFIEDLSLSIFSGGTLVLSELGLNQDAHALTSMISQNQVSGISLPTSYWSHVCQELPSINAQLKTSSLQFCIVGGEAMKREDFNQWQACMGADISLFNTYGPTETTVVSTYMDVSSVQLPWDNAPPIGQQMGNAQLFVLDSQQRLLPKCTVGELYIGGAGLARGYLNHPKLTAERFIDNPYDHQFSDRLYRTGDLVRYLPDGQLVFMGRKDNQVKIRGFRVELGEIQTHLSQLNGVASCAVIAKHKAQQNQLIAYLVADTQGQSESYYIDQIKLALSKRLPDFMLPSAYVLLGEWPLTPNGKIDQKALPTPHINTEKARFVAPQNVIQQRLSALWSKVLNLPLDRISIHANFFELGGHSLTVIRLLATIRASLGYELSVKEVFQYPVLSDFALLLTQNRKSALPPIVAVPRNSDMMLTSYAQQRLWFIDQMQGGSAHYNMPAAMRLTGQFDVDVAQSVFQTLIQRHESLRTVFREVDAQPMQLIKTDVKFLITQHDLTNLNTEEQQQRIQKTIQDDFEKTFNLSQDLMLRVSYLLINQNENVMIFNMHHIASDGWSMDVLIGEFAQLYQAQLTGINNPLTPLDIQYADYAHWQRQWLKGDVLESQLKYWDQQLAGLPQVHDLPLDFERPKNQTFTGAIHPFSLDHDVLTQLNEVAKRHTVTLFMVMHAAFSIVLSRYSANNDIVVGAPVANRSNKAVEKLIGFFVNTLILRVDCSGELTLDAFIQNIKAVNLDAQANQDVPFEHLVDRLKPVRSTRYNALFQVMLNMDNDELSALTLPGVQLTPEPAESRIAKFDLILNATTNNDIKEHGGLNLSFVYNTDLFKPSTVQRLANSLMVILKAVADQSQQPIKQLSIMSGEDQQQLFKGFKGAPTPYPNESCIHHIFEQQVEQFPNQVALYCEGKTLTYATLNARANQLAHLLIEMQVKPDHIVGICLNRSLDMMIAILSVLKAGAAYLPLDPEYPKKRLKFMIQDSNLDVVITHEQSLDLSQDISDKSLFVDDQDVMEALSKQPTVNPKVDELTSHHLAYVIYTSGSTGLPKGVMIEHHSAVNMAQYQRQHFSVDQHSRVLHFASINFDAATSEWMMALLTGARLYVCNQDTRHSTDLLKNELLMHQITHVTLPPAVLQLLDFRHDYALIALIVAGEAFEATLIHLWGTHYDFFNAYGPTEATVNVSTSVALSKELNIGRAIDNAQLYVLDAHQQPLPVGCVGELYIGGVGLARGYLNQPQLTSERFLNLTFNGENKRVYRTGDMVRCTDEGNLVFMGRVDDQIKIRGFRVELGEIAQQLSHCEGVKSFHIDVVEGQKLIAYITTEEPIKNESLFIQSLRLSLQQDLPNYMIPAAFVILTALPLTANGKIDREALPQPDMSVAEYMAPVGETEQALTNIWSHILDIPKENISAEANFFELGGHSLLTLKLIQAIDANLSVNISTKSLFEHASIRQLANYIVSQQNKDGVFKIIPQLTSSTVPLSASQLRVWYVDQFLDSNQNNIAGGVNINGLLNKQHLLSSIQYLVDKHAILRTSIEVINQLPIQMIHEQVKSQLDDYDLTGLSVVERDQRMNDLIHQHATQRFNLQQSSLFSVLLIQLSEEQWTLHFNFHHIIFDGWSLIMFINELIAAYQTINTGGQLPVVASNITYGDFSIWQKGFAKTAEYATQKAFWRDYLHDMTIGCELPYAPQSAEHSDNEINLEAFIDPQTHQLLSQLSRQYQGSLFNVIQASMGLMLARISGEQQVTIGVPVSGRHIAGTDQLLGMFINNLPVKTEVDLTRRFCDYLSDQVNNVQSVLSHQDVAFETIAEMVQQNIGGHKSSMFDAFLNMLSLPEMNVNSENFQVSFNNAVQMDNKFDLSFYVNQHQSAIVDVICVFNQKKYHREGLTTFLHQWQQLLQQIAANPEEKCGEYTMRNLGAAHQATSLIPDMHMKQSQDWPGSVIDCFQHQVSAQPDKACVVFAGKQLSYAEMDHLSRNVAVLLRSNAIAHGDVVAVLAERQPMLVACVLGVMKMGAVYMMVSAEQPELLSQHIKTSGAKTLLVLSSDERVDLDAVMEKHQGKVIMVNDNTLINQCNELGSITNVQFNPGDLAYIAMTSGTESEPKVIQGKHSSLTAYLPWTIKRFGLSANDRFAMLSGLLHDPWQREVFTALALGATLFIPDEQEYDFATCTLWLRENHLSVLNVTPGLAAYLLSTDGESLPEVTTVFLGGERLAPMQLRTLYQVVPNAQLINLYGTTETCRALSYYTISPEDADKSELPIGKGMADIQLIVLNELKNQCGIGEMGEIGIRSPHLSLGYKNDPTLTQQKFIKTPYSSIEGDLIYLTGDSGYYLDSGDVHYVGRADRQIKINGNRLEISSIEHQMSALPGVRRVHVHVNNHEQIIAHVSLHEAVREGFDVQQYKRQLKTTLPPHAIPTIINVIDTIPLTANGKIDTKKLNQLDHHSQHRTLLPPENDIEKQLLQMWKELLNISDVCTSDDFFDVGGHSLLVTQLFLKVDGKYKVKLSYQTFYTSNSIQSVAKEIEVALLLDDVAQEPAKQNTMMI